MHTSRQCCECIRWNTIASISHLKQCNGWRYWSWIPKTASATKKTKRKTKSPIRDSATERRNTEPGVLMNLQNSETLDYYYYYYYYYYSALQIVGYVDPKKRSLGQWNHRTERHQIGSYAHIMKKSLGQWNCRTQRATATAQETKRTTSATRETIIVSAVEPAINTNQTFWPSSIVQKISIGTKISAATSNHAQIYTYKVTEIQHIDAWGVVPVLPWVSVSRSFYLRAKMHGDPALELTSVLVDFSETA